MIVCISQYCIVGNGVITSWPMSEMLMIFVGISCDLQISGSLYPQSSMSTYLLPNSFYILFARSFQNFVAQWACYSFQRNWNINHRRYLLNTVTEMVVGVHAYWQCLSVSGQLCNIHCFAVKRDRIFSTTNSSFKTPNGTITAIPRITKAW